MRRFPTEPPLCAGERVLDEPTSHHVLNVLRCSPGTTLVLFDGQGREARGTLVDTRQAQAVVVVEGPIRSTVSEAELHLLLGIPKGSAMDRAVRMATEAGVTHVHPLYTVRSVVKTGRSDRWERIAASAAQQCGRADVPQVLAVATLHEALARLPFPVDLRVAMPGAGDRPCSVGPAAVVIGPEGGLTTEEVALCMESGGTTMGLGRWVLRTDTAAAIALALTRPRI